MAPMVVHRTAANHSFVPQGPDGLESIDARWEDEVLFDVDPPGRHVLTTPHHSGPLRIRAFPDLSIVREVEPPPDAGWDLYACFAGEHIIAKTCSDTDEETPAVIDRHGSITTLARSEHPITPGPDGSRLTSTPEGFERWTLRR